MNGTLVVRLSDSTLTMAKQFASWVFGPFSNPTKAPIAVLLGAASNVMFLYIIALVIAYAIVPFPSWPMNPLRDILLVSAKIDMLLIT